MDENKYSVIAESISKCYKMYSNPKEKLLDLVLPKGAGKDFYALKDISFKVNSGDVVGLIGLNGSGKSTLSNILGGVSMPTKGSIQINGESSLIAIGLGLNNFLTGIENIEVKSIMMGYKKEEIEKITQEIIDFADIGDFINQPIRTYSSGMRSRLGFAISVYTNPDILVIDEALSVGDPTFTQKCLDKMNEFKRKGKTIFFVSHSTSQIKQFCNKVIWLEYGSLKDFGYIDEILPKYNEYIKFVNSMTDYEKKAYKKIVLQHQEHALLNEFKLIDPKFKKVKPKGTFIKYVCLINKLENIKIVPYNIDLLTFVFGFLPSMFRKNIMMMILILALQVSNFFIISYPFNILTNFVITGTLSLITGKNNVNNLIEKNGYIDYNLWELNQFDLGSKESILNKNKEIKKRKEKQNKYTVILTVMLTIIIPLTSIYYINKVYNEKIAVTSNTYKEFNGNVAIVLTNKDSNNSEKIESIGLMQKGSQVGTLNIVIYDGSQQVNNNDQVGELKNLINLENESSLKETLKENFNEEITNYIVINMKEFGIEKTYENINELYKDELYNLLNDDERKINEKKAKLYKCKSSIKKEEIDKFIIDFSNIKNIDSEKSV